MEYRAGIIPAMDILVQVMGGMERVLPAEHRVRATRANVDMEMTEYLVEGPLMPIVTAGADPVTTLIICQSHGNRITEPVTAWFEHAPAATWVIPPK